MWIETIINAIILFIMAGFAFLLLIVVGNFVLNGIENMESGALSLVAVVVSVIAIYLCANFLGWTDPSPELVPRTLHEIVTGSSTHAEDY